jgi:prepilin-type processing-associated H-X9-DG protein
MSVWFGGFGGSLDVQFTDLPGVASPPWRLYLKLSDIGDPGPSGALLFWDERADTINYGNFFTDMSGFPNQPGLARFSGDMPASYHNGAGGLCFADGHAETHRWRDARTTPPLQTGSLYAEWGQLSAFFASPNNLDIVWLQWRATRLMN